MAALTAINVAFNLVSWLLGADRRHSSFVPLDDLFADYFKLILSYPGGDRVHPGDLFGLHDTIVALTVDNPYTAAGKAGVTAIGTNLHLMPVTTLLGLANLAAMRVAAPAALFAGLGLLLLVYWVAIACRSAERAGTRLAWIVLGVISYPMLVMVVRGNLYAGLTALLIVHALLLALRGRGSPVAIALLLALAINIRPNAILFALPLLAALPRARRARAAATLGLAGGALFLLSLFAAHRLYPSYDLTSFRHALGIYYGMYAHRNFGLAYGSSLLGGLKLLYAYDPRVDLARLAMVPALAILASAAALFARRRIDLATLIFLTAAAYTLGSTVLADYHLLVFLAVPMAIACERPTGSASPLTTIAFAAACFVIAPKNYGFTDAISWQVLLNPLLLLAASIMIIVAAAIEQQNVAGPEPSGTRTDGPVPAAG